MSGALVPYNISLPAASGPWTYTPFRDGPAATGWNASYSGNETWPYWQTTESLGSGNLFFRTQFDTAKIGLEFTGVGLVLCVTGNGATYTLTVDGKIVRTTGARNDPACADYGSTSTLVANGLDFGRHAAEVNVATASENDEFMFWGGTVATRVAVGSSSEQVTERMVDDSAAEWVMVPGRGRQQVSFSSPSGYPCPTTDLAHRHPTWWDVSVHSNNYQTTSSFMCFFRPNATASYTFRGASAIVLYGGLYRDTHDYSVTLDDRTVNLDASASGWDIGSTPIFFESNLDPNAQHTITLRDYNDNNPTCSGPSIKDFRSCCVSLDALKLIGSEASLSTSVTSSATLAPAPTSTEATQSSPTGTSSVQQQPQPSQQSVKSESNSTSAGAIAGGVLGGILGGLIIAVAGYCLIRHRRRSQRSSYAEPTRQLDLHGGAGSVNSSSVRPYIPPPASSAYSSTSAAGNSYTGASDRKGSLFAAGAAPVGYVPSRSLPGGYAAGAGPSNSQPPHPSSGKGHRPIPPVPVSYTSSSSAGSGRDAVPLQPEDMNRVLQYVSEQMSTRGRPGGSTAADTLPSYQR